LRTPAATASAACKLAAVPSAKPFVYLRNEAYVFRRLVNRTLFRRRLQGDVVERFTEVYYEGALLGDTRADTRWLGVRTDKCPLDLWIYQELLHELKPDLIVETGTAFGGSALYLASLCDLLGRGEVLTIDVQPQEGRPEHPRLEYFHGSSVAPETLEYVRSRAAKAGTVLVVLDSDHRKEHVLEELRLYAPLVTPGSYVVVEDTILNGHPVSPDFGPGPMEAAEVFLRTESAFKVDRGREKLYLTFNPKGYLRRTG
jgi:cephalosporin hydroxylase